MKVAASHLLCDTKEFPKLTAAVERLQRHGFEAIEVGAFERWGQGLSPARLEGDEAYFDQSVNILQASGLAVPSLNCAPGPELLLSPEAEKPYALELAALTRFARALGADQITLQVPQAPEEWDTSRIVKEFAARMIRVIESIPDHGQVRYAVEAHAQTFMEHPDVALAVMERTYPLLGLTYDPSHQIMIGVPLRETEPLFRYTVKAHLRDARRGEMQAPWGEGELDADWVLARLSEYGYDDFITAEYFGGFDRDLESARAIQAFVESATGA